MNHLIPVPDVTQRSLLAEAFQISRFLVQARHNPAAVVAPAQARFRAIRERLTSYEHPVCQVALPVAEIPLAVRQSFVQAVLLLTRYPEVGGQAWQGTLHSPTLSRYRPDPIPAYWQAPELVTVLGTVFELPLEVQQALTAILQAVDRHIAEHTLIMQTVLAEIQEQVVSPSRSRHSAAAAIATLFRHLFGEIPIPVEALDCVYTPMQIYFCIAYQGDRLSQEAQWNALSAEQQGQVRAFFRSFKDVGMGQFQRFPTFGPCRASQIDRAWCDRLAHQLGVSPYAILNVLVRSVSILPTEKAEAFLVHDIWGHHWQLLLTEFASDYTTLKFCEEPLRAAETAYTPYGPLSCREVFQRTGSQVQVDAEKARWFFRGEAQQRLGLMFTHLIGEMLADIAEFKFVWEHPESVDQLPSSSLFKTKPTKLDLSLADLDFLFVRVLRSLLDLQVSASEETDLERDLLQEWGVLLKVDTLELRTRLKQAILTLYQIFWEEYNTTYLPTVTGEPGLFTQIISNLLHLQNTVDRLYTNAAMLETLALPVQDLLLLFIGTSCAKDSYAEFWAIDNILATYFVPCCYLLTQVAPLVNQE